MLLDFLLSAGTVALIVAGIAAFFWIVVTIMIRRVNRGEVRQTNSQREEELEAVIDAEVEALRQKSGKVPPPPIAS